MDAGILLPTRALALAGRPDARSPLDFARAVERHGFASLWANDSLTARPRLEPLTGRLTLGLGAGFPYPASEAEFRAAGVPFGERTGWLVETVRAWCAIEWVGTIGVAVARRRCAFAELVTTAGRVRDWHVLFDTLGA